MDVNYFGSIYATRAVIAEMKRRRQGRVVFLSSQAGLIGMYGFSGYSPTKFALRGLAEALQMEVSRFAEYWEIASLCDQLIFNMLVLGRIAATVCLSLCLCVHLLVTFLSPAKTAELVVMLFGGWLMWARGTMYEMGVQIPQGVGTFFWYCLAHWKAFSVTTALHAAKN